MGHEFDVAICMPYFDRLDFLDNTMASFIHHGYFDAGYEPKIQLSIVDDGSPNTPIPALWGQSYGLHGNQFVLQRLPMKNIHLNPCVPLNRAVAQSDAPIILLQSPETYHETQILRKEVVDNLKREDDIINVPTKTKNTEKWPWYAHPVHRPVRYWFCQLMTRWMFDGVGGVDEKFRAGTSFDDDYLEMVLTHANANWMWAEEEVAVHVSPRKRKRKNRKGLKSNEVLFKQIRDFLNEEFS